MKAGSSKRKAGLGKVKVSDLGERVGGEGLGRGVTPEQMEAYALPSAYCGLVWGTVPYGWQGRAMDALVVDGNRVCVSTCNASGKTSFLIARACLWYMDAFPNSLVVTTSASQRQVGQQLYANIRRCVGMFPNAAEWRIRDNNQFWVKAPNGSSMVSFATNDAGRAEGYHVPDLPQGLHRGKGLSGEWRKYLEGCGVEELGETTRLLVVIDEAKSVDRGIFEAFERCRASNWLVVSTPPLNPMGPFYDCFRGEREKFRCQLTGDLNIWGGFEEYGLIGYRECPHLVDDEAQMRIIRADLKSKGEGSAFVQSMHLGKFPSAGDSMVFHMPSVDYAMSGMVPVVRGKRAFCCDFSGGGDGQPLGMRDGNMIRLLAKWNEGDSVRLARMIERELRLNGYNPREDEFIGDNGGIGESCNDILESMGIFVRRFNFQGSPRDKRVYANIRAEGYANLSKLVNLKQIVLPESQKLKEQLSWHCYEDPADNRMVKVSPKKNMPESPDDADVVMMLCYDYIPPSELSSGGGMGLGGLRRKGGSASACGGGLFGDLGEELMGGGRDRPEDPTRLSGLLF